MFSYTNLMSVGIKRGQFQDRADLLFLMLGFGAEEERGIKDATPASGLGIWVNVSYH